MKVKLSFFVVLFLFTSSLSAQFNISGEFRMRGEYRDGYLSLRDSSKTPYGTILGRARLLFDYKSEKLSTRFSFYDAWVFGQNNYSSDTISKNTVNVYEAFLKYNFTKEFALKIGRTELVYGDERFFGSSSWSMWGATHDIILAQVDMSERKYRGDMGFAVNNTAPAAQPYLSSYQLRNYKYMGFLVEQRKFMKDKLTFSFVGVVDAYQKNSSSTTTKTVKNDTLFVKDPDGKIIGYTINKTTTSTTKITDYPNDLYARYTLAFDGKVEMKRWSAFANGAYQGGHTKDGRKISSWFYTFWLSVQPTDHWKFLGGYEHLGGNDFSDTNDFKKTVRGFSTLYGTSHRFYGYMDLFTTLVRDNLSTGLNDAYLRVTYNFNEKMFLEGTYRWFSIPNPYLYVSKPVSGPHYEKVKTSSLGSEIDLMYVYKPIQNLELNMAYCFFLQTETMEKMNSVAAGKSQFAQYAYLMVTYKPNFFNSEKK